MDTEPLEKELQIWDRLMYIALGSSSTLLIISFGHFFYGNQWPYFENYAGGLWQWMQIAITPPGFYLLSSKRWKLLPVSSRKIPIIGFFAASWITFLSLGFITVNDALIYFNFFIIGIAALIALGYMEKIKKKSNQPDEMFP
jgi:hypothetical protein